MRRLFEGGHYYAQLWDCAASIRGRPLLRSALGLCGAYSRAATITLSSGIVRRLFEGGHYYAQLWGCAASIRGRPLLRSALGLCSAYSRAATITLSSGIVQRLFEGGHYYAQLWGCAAPIRGRPLLRSSGIVRHLFEGGHYYAQLWGCAAPIRGQLLNGVRRLFDEIRYIQCIYIIYIYMCTGDVADEYGSQPLVMPPSVIGLCPPAQTRVSDILC